MFYICSNIMYNAFSDNLYSLTFKSQVKKKIESIQLRTITLTVTFIIKQIYQ